MRESLFEYCTRMNKEALLQEWNEERNRGCSPQSVTYGSKAKVWWKCGRGHVWQAAIVSRTVQGSGCPVCSGHQIVTGVNDLQTLYPTVAAEWHPEKNEALSPSEISPGSHRKVWWCCSFGHEWQATVKSRCEGYQCPVCSGKVVIAGVNDLAVEYPALAAEWHPFWNGALTPQDVRSGSRRKVWWQCAQGHEWQAVISSRSLESSGCPVCTGKRIISGENDLETRFPTIAAHWNAKRNGKLKPNEISPFSNRKVWWICELGYEWRADIKDCTAKQSSCPYCSGRKVLPGFNDLATIYPEIAAQWHPELNGALTPQDVTADSAKKVWWICPDGHVWKAVVYSRTSTKKTGCPICAGTRKLRR